MTVSNNELYPKNLPTLSDVLLVEKTLQNSEESIITVPELKKLLKSKINQNTLMIILNYLEEMNKIVVTSKGIAWIHSTKKLLELLDSLLEKSELTEKDALEIGRKIKQDIAKKHGLVK